MTSSMPTPNASATSASKAGMPGPTGTAIENVFETLLADIVRGTYVAGSRLPAERELARILGASRPTLREALRRLGEYNLVEPRRGSGVVVRPWREWSLEVLPGYLRYAKPTPQQPTMARVVLDMMEMRRTILSSVLGMIAGRVTHESLASTRSALARAWAARTEPMQFAQEDFQILVCLAEAAGFVPGMWLLNRMSTVYLDVTKTMSHSMLPPDDYLDVYQRMFEHLERGESDAATKMINAWWQRTDRVITTALEMLA